MTHLKNLGSKPDRTSLGTADFSLSSLTLTLRLTHHCSFMRTLKVWTTTNETQEQTYA